MNFAYEKPVMSCVGGLLAWWLGRRSLPDLWLACDHFMGNGVRYGSNNQAYSAFYPAAVGK